MTTGRPAASLASPNALEDSSPSGLLEVLREAYNSGHWDLLAAAWATHGSELLQRVPGCKDLFAAAPISGVAASPSLREARETAHAMAARGQSAPAFDVTDPPHQLAYVFGTGRPHSDAPRHLGADDIVTQAVHEIRRRRTEGDFVAAKQASENVAIALSKLKHLDEVPTVRNSVRLQLEYGVTEFTSGDLGRGIERADRAMQVARDALPVSSSLRATTVGWRACLRSLSSFTPTDRETNRVLSCENSDAAQFEQNRGLPIVLAHAFKALDQLDLDSPHFRTLEEVMTTSASLLSAISVYVVHRRDLLLGETSKGASTLEYYWDDMRPVVRESPTIDFLHTAAWAHQLLQTGSAYRALIQVRSLVAGRGACTPWGAHLLIATGQHERAFNISRAARFDGEYTVREKAEFAALAAASLWSLGAHAQALEGFRAVLRSAAATRSLIPVALLPWEPRDELIAASATAPEWSLLQQSFQLDEGVLVERLCRSSSHSASLSLAPLSKDNLQILCLLDTEMSIADIALALSVARGTAKNKLSALYKAMGVKGRRAAVAFGYEHGFLPTTLDRAAGSGNTLQPQARRDL